MLSTLFAGDFAGAGIGVAFVFAVNKGTRVIESIKGLNLQDAIFRSMQMIDPHTHLIRGPMPWKGIAFSFALSLLLAACACKVPTNRDF